MACELLTVEQMVAADKAAIASGIPSQQLMETAGSAVAQEILARYPKGNVLILCGPGNNGGDGFVVARHLQAEGWKVEVALFGEVKNLKGDAALMAEQWGGEIHALDQSLMADKTLIVDALFGTGLQRDLQGDVYAIAQAVNASNIPVVAVDISSGIEGNAGQIKGCAIKAEVTVTFHRKKLGHVLQPGKHYAGEVVCVPIGIPDAVMHDALYIYENHPALWLGDFPFPKDDSHKYNRGHVAVRGGQKGMTGAAAMAAYACARLAGLVTIVCDAATLPIYAAQFLSVMTAEVNNVNGWQFLLTDERKNTVVIGPGNGITDDTKDAVLAALALQKSAVLDADGLSVFADEPQILWDAIQSSVVLTPHEGEFARLFPDLKGDKIDRAKVAAKRSNAVIILKGNDTVIANPQGNVVINTHAPAYLATAGSGDVLAGIVGGMLANGVGAFAAACMAVWLHGEAAWLAGIGMMAQELPDYIPEVLAALQLEAEGNENG